MQVRISPLSGKQRKFLKEVLGNEEFTDTVLLSTLNLARSVMLQGYYLPGNERKALQDIRALWIEFMQNRSTESDSEMTDAERMLAHLKKRYKQYRNNQI